MIDPLRISFSQVENFLGEAGWFPLLPISLIFKDKHIETTGLPDTGAAVNVLPFSVGLALSAVWEHQKTALRLTGNLANFEARAILLHAKIGEFNTRQLAFAWTFTDEVPLLLGQMNFFAEFDVCFFRSQLAFEVKTAK